MSQEEQRGWMYSGWNEQGLHSAEWVRNTAVFLDQAFQIMPNANQHGVNCPCSKCCNRVRQKQPLVRSQLFKWGFIPGYTRWTEHGDLPFVSSTRTKEKPCSSSDPLAADVLVDAGDAAQAHGMLELKPSADGNEPTADANDFQNKLIAAEEPLHSRTEVSRLSFVKQLMEIKAQQNLSDESIDALLALLCDAAPEGHKVPANVSECKNMLSDLKMPCFETDKTDGESSKRKRTRLPRK